MSAHRDLAPSPWIVRFAHLIPAGARVLDLAAGHGRHARFFAARGAQVVAADRDAEALAPLADDPRIAIRTCDLEAGAWPFAAEPFDAIVVVNYLHRQLFAHLRSALAPDGVLLYETFALGNEAFGRPSNPEFLLCRDELLTVAALPPAPLTVVAFEQGMVEAGARRAIVQRLAAVGPACAWPPALPER
ncbi:MAG: class I SAM-dependent methyltransferase [Casimicrobiaceae bacterium]